MTEPPKRGGKRQGAGRKPNPLKRVNLTVSLPPKNKLWITSKAKATGISASELVTMWSDRKNDKAETPL